MLGDMKFGMMFGELSVDLEGVVGEVDVDVTGTGESNGMLSPPAEVLKSLTKETFRAALSSATYWLASEPEGTRSRFASVLAAAAAPRE